MATGNGNNHTHNPNAPQPDTAARAASATAKVKTAAKGPGFLRLPGKVKVALPIMLILVTVGVHANGIGGAFVFDDEAYIVGNPNIRSFDKAFNRNANQEARPTVYATLALNYALFELNPKGYHLFNLLIHILTMLAMFGLVRRTLLLPILRASFEKASPWLAFSVALLWAIHPLQSECVAYVFQRSESMQALFYLLAIYSYLQSAFTHGKRRALWTVACLFAAVLGMGCKASFITLPVVLFLYDRVFISKSIAEAVRKRGYLIAVVLLTVVGMGMATADIHRMVLGYGETTAPDAVKFSVGYAATPMEYIGSQPTVILKYLKLAFWPASLCLDYRMPPVDDMAQILLTASAFLLLLGLAGGLLWRVPPLGFCLLFVFIVLAPTALYWKMELMFTYRMYLPLAGLICTVVFLCVALFKWLVRTGRLSPNAATVIGAAAVILLSIGLGWRTMIHNRDFRNPYTLYRCVVKNCPENPRGRYNLANRLVRRYKRLKKNGEEQAADAALSEAVHHYTEAITQFPWYIEAHVNLAIAYSFAGREDALIEVLSDAVTWYPDHAVAHFNLAQAYRNRGLSARRSGRTVSAMRDFELAAKHYRESLILRPGHHGAVFGEGLSLYFLERYAEAAEILGAYVKNNPQNPDTLRLLGNCLYKLRRYPEAEKLLRGYLQADPASRWAKKNLRKVAKAQARMTTNLK